MKIIFMQKFIIILYNEWNAVTHMNRCGYFINKKLFAKQPEVIYITLFGSHNIYRIMTPEQLKDLHR